MADACASPRESIAPPTVTSAAGATPPRKEVSSLSQLLGADDNGRERHEYEPVRHKQNSHEVAR